MTRPRARWGLLLSLALVGVTACDDDPQAPTPDAGPAGRPVGAAEQIEALITGVAVVDDRLRVDFDLRDADGVGLDGLDGERARFTLARVDDAGGGWRAVIHRPAAVDGVARPAADAGGELLAGGEGRYTYVFAGPVTELGALAGVPWQPAAVHRVGLYLDPPLAPANATVDVVPSTGAAADGPRVASTSACDACHSRLAHHAGARREVALCVTCHTVGAVDAGGASLDFDVMIHRLHMGRRLPSVAAGGSSVLVDGDGVPHDRSRLRLPMHIENCATCHDDDRPQAPDGGRWRSAIDRAACGACHDDVDFALGDAGGHPGGPQLDDARCVECHASEGEAGSVAEAHALPQQRWAARFTYEVLAITDTAPGQTPRITYRVVDPDGAPYDLERDPSFTAANVRLMLDLSWSTAEHGVANDGPPPASPLAIDALTGAANGDGSYTVESPAPVPDDATGTGALVFEGHPMGDFQGDGTLTDPVPVRTAVRYFPITDAEPVPRRRVVDAEKCLGCHGRNDGLARHGGNRVDVVEACVTCHNPNNTDLAQRPTDPDGAHDGVNTAARDGLEQRSVDFNLLVHAIHGAQMRSTPFLLYGYLNLPHDFSDVRFPGDLGRCETCHLPDTYTLPVQGARLSRTDDSGATVTRADFFGLPTLDDPAAARDPADDRVTTPTAAACSGCHDGDAAARHMIETGAGIGAPASDAAGERCVECHGRGEQYAVERVHRPGRWAPAPVE